MTGVAAAVTIRRGAAAVGATCAARRSSRRRRWTLPATTPPDVGAGTSAVHGRGAPACGPYAPCGGACQARARDAPLPAGVASSPACRHFHLWGEWGGKAVSRPPPATAVAVCERALSAPRWGRGGRRHVHGGRSVASRRRPSARLGPSRAQQNEAGPRAARYRFEGPPQERGPPRVSTLRKRPRYFVTKIVHVVKDSGRAATARAPRPPAPPSVATAPGEKKNRKGRLGSRPRRQQQHKKEPTRQTSGGGAPLTPRPRAAGRRRQRPGRRQWRPDAQAGKNITAGERPAPAPPPPRATRHHGCGCARTTGSGGGCLGRGRLLPPLRGLPAAAARMRAAVVLPTRAIRPPTGCRRTR